MTPSLQHKLLASLTALSLVATSQVALAQTADMVIHNADIRTMDQTQPEAEAVAITGDTITYVGDDEGVQAYIGDGTRVIDAEDHLLIPGFQETHLHLLVAAATISGLVLQQTDSPEVVARKLAEFAKAHPERQAIFGSGLNSALIVSGKLNRSILDAVVSDRPVVILGETNHNAWVNTKALEIAKITKDTKDPPNGTYVRDANGDATGVIQGSPAHLPVIIATNAVSSEAIAGAMPEMLNILSGFGFTGAIDMGFPLATEEGYQSLIDLDKEGKLPLRVSLAYFVNSVAAGDKVLATIDDFSKRFKSDHVWLDTVKIIGDGVVENRKAAFLEPYLDTGTSGALTLPVDYMNDLVLKSAKMGYNVTAHVVGDKGIRAILDAYEKARKAGYEDVILSSTHSWWVQPEDILRWKKNNVIVQTTGIWAFTRPSYYEALGKKRVETLQFPYRKWEDSGAIVALGADYPATDGGIDGLNPFNNIYSLLTRKLAPPLVGNVAGTEKQLPPYDQVMTMAEAVKGYTANGARMMGKFDEWGSITVGKKADMIVLSQNLFDIDVSDVPKTMVLMTMMDGKVRYLEPELAAGPLADLDIGHDWQE